MTPIQDLISRILFILDDEGGLNTLFLIENNHSDSWIVSAIDRDRLTTLSVAESDTLYSAFEILLDIINEDDGPTIH
jgi:hypothetical protein